MIGTGVTVTRLGVRASGTENESDGGAGKGAGEEVEAEAKKEVETGTERGGAKAVEETSAAFGDVTVKNEVGDGLRSSGDPGTGPFTVSLGSTKWPATGGAIVGEANRDGLFPTELDRLEFDGRLPCDVDSTWLLLSGTAGTVTGIEGGGGIAVGASAEVAAFSHAVIQPS
jgi:hypothetical protein